MRVITQIGEQGLEHPDGRCAVLRPSLYAMSSLGTPEQIVEKFSELHSSPSFMTFDESGSYGVKLAGMEVNKQRMRDHWRAMLYLSWEILTACSEHDLSPFIGEPGERYASYRLGPVPPEAMLALARSLMQHGIIGPMPKKQNGDPVQPAKSKYTPKFDALSFVSKAVAHLGFSEADAWNMTMTSFAANWEAKFGENKQERHSEEHDDTMAWLAKVNEQRKPKQ